MSPPAQVLLLDSNAYFRLAYSIPALLKTPVGRDPQHLLHVIAALDDEYRKNPRLRTKFNWVNEREYQQDRAIRRLELRGKDAEDAKRTMSYLIDQEKELGLNLALADIKALAAGYVLKCPVVSDDKGMHTLGAAFGIDVWGIVKLLKLMVTNGRIDMEKVNEILEFLQYENDLPMPLHRLRQEFKNYFGQDCPL